MKNSRNYTKDGLILGLAIGAVAFVGYMFYGFFTLDSESLGYFKLGLPLLAAEFVLLSIMICTLVGWIYGKMKKSSSSVQ